MTKLVKLYLSLLFIFSVESTFAQNIPINGWCEDGGVNVTVGSLQSTTQVQSSYPGCSITVYVSGTMTKASIYNSSGAPLTNPFTADSTTGRWTFYAAASLYDVSISGGNNGGIPIPYTITVSSSGGGGSVIWPTTGDIVISNGASSPTGLAPVNGDCVVGAGGLWTAGNCSGTSSGVVGSGTTGQFAQYASSGTTVSGHTLVAADVPGATALETTFVSCLAYSCDPSGATATDVQIQNGINDLATKTNGPGTCLYFPAGTYQLANRLILGNSTCIKRDPGAKFFNNVPNGGISVDHVNFIAQSNLGGTVSTSTPIAYVSGGTVSGTGTCIAAASNGGGSGSTGTFLATSGTISGNLTLTSLNPAGTNGYAYSTVPTNWSIFNGTATCSGTAVTSGGALKGTFPDAPTVVPEYDLFPSLISLQAASLGSSTFTCSSGNCISALSPAMTDGSWIVMAEGASPKWDTYRAYVTVVSHTANSITISRPLDWALGTSSTNQGFFRYVPTTNIVIDGGQDTGNSYANATFYPEYTVDLKIKNTVSHIANDLPSNGNAVGSKISNLTLYSGIFGGFDYGTDDSAEFVTAYNVGNNSEESDQGAARIDYSHWIILNPTANTTIFGDDKNARSHSYMDMYIDGSGAFPGTIFFVGGSNINIQKVHATNMGAGYFLNMCPYSSTIPCDGLSINNSFFSGTGSGQVSLNAATNVNIVANTFETGGDWILGGFSGSASRICNNSGTASATKICDGGGSGTVTSFAAPSGSWPSWFVPTVTNSTSTPSLAVAATTQGNGGKVQLSTGSTTTNDCVKFDSNGNTVDAGAACGSGGSTTVSSADGSVAVTPISGGYNVAIVPGPSGAFCVGGAAGCPDTTPGTFDAVTSVLSFQNAAESFNGLKTFNKPVIYAVNIATSSATPAFTLLSGKYQTVTLTANVTSFTISGLTQAGEWCFDFIQGGSGSYTVSGAPASFHGFFTIPGSEAVGKHNTQCFYSPDGTNLYSESAGATNQ